MLAYIISYQLFLAPPIGSPIYTDHTTYNSFMVLTPCIILVFNIPNDLLFIFYSYYYFSFKYPVLAAAPDILSISYIYILYYSFLVIYILTFIRSL